MQKKKVERVDQVALKQNLLAWAKGHNAKQELADRLELVNGLLEERGLAHAAGWGVVPPKSLKDLWPLLPAWPKKIQGGKLKRPLGELEKHPANIIAQARRSQVGRDFCNRYIGHDEKNHTYWRKRPV